jgi:PAS domain S-box-containing protein
MPAKISFSSTNGAGHKPGRRKAAPSSRSQRLNGGVNSTSPRRPIPGAYRRFLDEEVRKRELAFEAMRLAEEKYHSIFENSVEGIFQTSPEGAYLSANPALAHIYGYASPGELLQSVRDIGHQLYVSPSRRQEFVQVMEEHDTVIDFESEIYRKDGTKRWILENVRSVKRGGSVLYYEGTVQDITERKRAQEQRREAMQALLKSQQLLASELTEAAQYVRSLLPAPRTEPKADWRYLPSSQLGGDAFGYQWIDEDHFAIYLLDVSGHGIGAALLSISLMNMIRAQTLPHTDFHDPSAVLSALNKTFPFDRQNSKFFTIWYGVFSRSKRELTFATGGHHGAAFIGGEQGIRLANLRTNGPLVGVLPGAKFVNRSFPIDGPGRLYVFSDGAFEITRPDGIMLDFNQFAALLFSLPPDSDNLDEILRRLKELRGVAEFEDDLSIIEIVFE